MSFPIDLDEEQLKQAVECLEGLEESLADLYNKTSSSYFDKIEEEYKLHIWEEQDYEENKYMYEYDLEHLEDLAKREKM